MGDDYTPLFITEGTAQNKLASIHHSDYLSFAYREFEQHDGPLVVFGQALGDSDKHLVEAIDGWGKRPIAIGMLPSDSESIRKRKLALHQQLPKAELLFFNATTHPLGSPNLKVARPTP